MAEREMADRHALRGRFLWYELMTTDTAAAKRFYGKVMGWSMQDASTAAMCYTLLMAGPTSVGGLTRLPKEVLAMGVPPHWLGYIGIDDVDAAVKQIRQHGGAVHAPPTEIPNIGRFAIIADPQLATLALVKRSNPAQAPQVTLDKPGHVGWHELLAADADTAFTFYHELFGWQKAAPEIETENGSISAYQPFSIGGQTIGGMFTKPPAAAKPFWLYYFNTRDMDAATECVVAAGGEILEGPIDVTGGSRVARCADPQGVMFALIERRKEKAPGYFERAAPSGGRGRRRWSW
jgi:predicted enzyme related to lactoylglutathione lyase